MTDTTDRAKRSREILDAIKHRLAVGVLTYDQAKDFATPHIHILNDELRRRARAAGLSPGPRITFTGYMR